LNRRKLLTLGGAVPRPGLYEVPFGIPLGEATEVLGGLAGPARGYVMGGYFAGLLNARGHELPLDYDALRAERLPAALIQGLRDFFGAHTYRRADRDGTFHTLWAEDDRSEEAR